MKSVIRASSPVSRGAPTPTPAASASAVRANPVGLCGQILRLIDSELAHVRALAVTLIATSGFPSASSVPVTSSMSSTI